MLVCEIVTDKKDGITVYGFRFSEREDSKEVYTVRDVFTDEQQARALCETINASEVCREHIRDIIEDAIGV
ncbi:MAG: hypothetical protein IJA60_08655 [Clostridia bacterium]|nr:hypothetical protein [Clostridia bacterium]